MFSFLFGLLDLFSDSTFGPNLKFNVMCLVLFAFIIVVVGAALLAR